MSFNLCYRLEELSEAKRQLCFANLVDVIPKETEDVDEWCISAMDFKKMLHPETNEVNSFPSSTIRVKHAKEDVMKYLKQNPDPSLHIGVDYTWDLWRPLQARGISGIDHKIDTLCEDCTYYGTKSGWYYWGDKENRKNKRIKSAIECYGDFRVGFRDFACVENEFPFMTYERSDELEKTETHIQKQFENIQKFRKFLFQSIEAVSPKDVIFVSCNSPYEAPIGASIIHHMHPQEFLRDLVRGFFMMHDSLLISKQCDLDQGDDKTTYYNYDYFGDELEEPENLCTEEIFVPLLESCIESIKYLSEHKAEALNNNDVCLPLFQLIEELDIAHLKDIILYANPESILEVIGTTDKAELTEIGGGYLLEHKISRKGDWASVYEDLVEAMINGDLT